MQDLATEFEAERDHLTAVAYRMLGSRAEAEDAVQETWLRYADALADPAARAEIRDLRGWLTTATAPDLPRRAAVGPGAPRGVPRSVAAEPLVTRLDRRAGARPRGARGARRRGRHGAAGRAGAAHPRAAGGVRAARRVRGAVRRDRGGAGHHRCRRPASSPPGPAGRSPTAAPRHTADLGRAAPGAGGVPGAPPSTGDLDGADGRCSRPTWCSSATAAAYFPAARQPIARRRPGRPVRARPAPAAMPPARAADVHAEIGRWSTAGSACWSTAVYQDGRPFRSVLSFAIDDGRITGVFNQLNPEKMTRVPRARRARLAATCRSLR